MADEGFNDLFINNTNEPYPYVKETSYSGDLRKIQLSSGNGILIAVIILAVVQVIMMIIGFTAFPDAKPIKIMFCVMELPFLLILLIVPYKAVCEYDYINKTFRNYVQGIIPIHYTCFSMNINFYDIAGFYLHKKKGVTKKYYIVGVKLQNGQNKVILTGQDTSCNMEYDRKLDYIPFILRRLLKGGEQNFV